MQSKYGTFILRAFLKSDGIYEALDIEDEAFDEKMMVVCEEFEVVRR